MSGSIHLGYEVGSGRGVSVPLGHLVVTGQTQKSGKTTTLEALITRSNLKAVAFVTKRGEKSFRLMTPIPPYFRERADWQFVQSILEATMKQKMDFKQAWIMRACDGADTLEDVQKNIQLFLKGEYEDVSSGRKGSKKKRVWHRKPATGLNADMYYVLNEYLDEVLPELRKLRSSKKLELRRGVNVMDLSPYSFAMQALVIRSVLEEVYTQHHGVIVIIPEAWEFIPEGRRSPVRLAAEELIRKGAAEKNYVWLDSQDIAGVAKVMLRQMEVWIFGVQRDSREIKRVMDSIPNIGGARTGLWDQIATMGRGQFIVAFGEQIRKVYVQPAGMDDAQAEAIARGEERPESWMQIVRALDEKANERQRDTADSDGARDPGDAGGDREEAAEDPAAHDGPDRAAEVDSTESEEEEMKLALLARALRIPNPEHATEEDVLAAIGNLVVAHDTLAERVRLAEEQGETVPYAENPAKRHPTSSAAADSVRPSTSQRTAGAAAAAEIDDFSPSFEALYQNIKRRAAEDTPAILQLLAQRPELRVKIDRPVLTMDGKSLQGRLARLLHEGFFLETRSGGDVLRECLRRGWVSAGYRTNLLHPHLKELAEMGFLTLEENGYQAVKGMKVEVVEEGARAQGAGR
jgi:hypothetical protein